LFLDWTDTLTVLPDAHEIAPDIRAELDRRGISVVDGRIIEIAIAGTMERSSCSTPVPTIRSIKSGNQTANPKNFGPLAFPSIVMIPQPIFDLFRLPHGRAFQGFTFRKARGSLPVRLCE